jgi:hypothetical protein
MFLLSSSRFYRRVVSDRIFFSADFFTERGARNGEEQLTNSLSRLTIDKNYRLTEVSIELIKKE